MWKPGLTCHWPPLCRRDRTQLHRDDRVPAVVWVVLDNHMSVFIWSCQSDDWYDRDDYMATWLYTKKVETARDDYMQTRLNRGFFFYTWHNKAISLIKPLLHVKTFRSRSCARRFETSFSRRCTV